AIIDLEGRLPLNIMFLAETEENVGSPNYGLFVEQYQDRLRRAQGAFCPGAVQAEDGQVKLTLGYKGLINLRFTAAGELWGKGPQKKAIHASAHSLIESPTWRLIEALATMRDPVTGKIAVKDFYADEEPITEEEKKEVRDFVARFEGQQWKEFLPNIGLDVKSANDDLDNVSATLKYFYSPSFNINGLASGYTGPGTEVFRLPNEAWALCDVRVPRGYSAQKTIERIKSHLAQTGYPDIKVEVIAAYEPYQSKLNSGLCRSLTSIFDENKIPWLAWPYVGGGGPWSLFAELGLPVMFDVGLGHGGNAGGIDEFLVVNGSDKYAGIIESQLFFVEFVHRFASQ
ncbi:MAG TPA: peptidase dimerization domain-containing protein, partial [bacterium]|nr:peptidase dimerization domain-containing protein [bacterium]